MAVAIAVMLPLVLLAVGSAIDFQRLGQQRAQLQEFSDTLALRGAKEFMIANSSAAQIESVVRSVADGSLPEELRLAPFHTEIRIDESEPSVTITLTQPARPALLLARFGNFGDEVSVSSTAVARGGMNLCVVALHDAASGAISTYDRASLEAPPCAIISNSKSSSGIIAERYSHIKAKLICSAGGAAGPGSNYSPSPTTDCPAYEDPLSMREPPPVGPCDFTSFQLTQRRRRDDDDDEPPGPPTPATLSPGVYCGGIRIGYNVEAEFSPGVYVIKDGPLSIGKASTLNGQSVAFYLVGDLAVFTFDREAKIAMAAPTSGPLAGIMFFEDRNAPLDRVHSILSDDAHEFLGTFYLPRGVLRVQTQQPVADASAYTAIIARRLELRGRPVLVLNADYSSTDVPAPEGVGPVGLDIFLRD
ncbi:MAG: hypothetical protein WD076_09325 [Parvularculaceae bacterium]